jgi:hypothetical protein
MGVSRPSASSNAGAGSRAESSIGRLCCSDSAGRGNARQRGCGAAAAHLRANWALPRAPGRRTPAQHTQRAPRFRDCRPPRLATTSPAAAGRCGSLQPRRAPGRGWTALCVKGSGRCGLWCRWSGARSGPRCASACIFAAVCKPATAPDRAVSLLDRGDGTMPVSWLSAALTSWRARLTRSAARARLIAVKLLGVGPSAPNFQGPGSSRDPSAGTAALLRWWRWVACWRRAAGREPGMGAPAAAAAAAAARAAESERSAAGGRRLEQHHVCLDRRSAMPKHQATCVLHRQVPGTSSGAPAQQPRPPAPAPRAARLTRRRAGPAPWPGCARGRAACAGS